MDMEVDEEVVLHPMQTEKSFIPTPDYADYKESFASSGTPIVIDNGMTGPFFLAAASVGHTGQLSDSRLS